VGKLQEREMAKKQTKTAPKEKASKSCLLILVGLPGSGKSTVAKELEKAGWIRANQDDLGSADACKKVLAKALKHDENVVLDRCNVMMKERKMFISESKRDFGVTQVECLFLDIPADECKRRVAERPNHPTLSPENGDEVIDSFLKGFKAPETREGYTRLMHAQSPEEVKGFVAELKKYGVEEEDTKGGKKKK